jgi:hypothetical protein
MHARYEANDKAAQKKKNAEDAVRIDWLQEQIVDVIYLDDGRIIDVRGLNLRKALDGAMTKTPNAEVSGAGTASAGLPG